MPGYAEVNFFRLLLHPMPFQEPNHDARVIGRAQATPAAVVPYLGWLPTMLRMVILQSFPQTSYLRMI